MKKQIRLNEIMTITLISHGTVEAKFLGAWRGMVRIQYENPNDGEIDTMDIAARYVESIVLAHYDLVLHDGTPMFQYVKQWAGMRTHLNNRTGFNLKSVTLTGYIQGGSIGVTHEDGRVSFVSMDKVLR